MNTQQIISHCNQVIKMATECKGSYFWTPGASAGARRSNERRRNIPSEVFEVDGVKWSVGYSYSESCSNVYASGSYYRDGNKVTLAAVKSLVKRLECDSQTEKLPKLPDLAKVARANTAGFGSN